MALCQTFKALSVSQAFLCLCVCPRISGRPRSDYDQTASVSLTAAWPLSPPPPNLYTSSLYQIISSSAAALERAPEHRGRASAWHCDTWQELQLWSAFCKESLAAENAAASHRFTAHATIPPSLDSPPEQEVKETTLRTVSFLTRSITSLFISFFNELTLTSADSTSGIWASSSLSPQWPPPKWQTSV